MTTPSDWDSTFIPGTDVLANKLGITDPATLRQREYTLTADIETQILDGQLPIPRTYDADHLRALHAALFDDIYDWAGVTRTYSMSKDDIPFAEPRQIPAYLDAAARHIARTDWDHLDHGGIAVEAATTYAYLNTAHPWREGNGRSSKLFMRQLLRDHGHDLDLSKITPAQWNNSSALTMPDRGTFEPVPDLLIPVFTRIITTYTPPTPGGNSATQAAAGPLSLGPNTTTPQTYRTPPPASRPYHRQQPHRSQTPRPYRGPTP